MSLISLNNKNIDPIIWEDGALCDHDPDTHIHIWQINIDEHLPQVDKLHNVLTPDEIVRANKYLRATDRDKFIVSRSSLRYILARYLKCEPATVNFKLTTNNKPQIGNHYTPQLHFNLSDSADKVLIAVAATPIGIDIELIKPQFSYHDILNNNFSFPEADFIRENDDLRRFFLLWTRKEAILKATGIGLTDHLKHIISLDGEHVMEGGLLSTANNWQLSSFGVGSDYIATVATHMLKNNFRFFNFR